MARWTGELRHVLSAIDSALQRRHVQQLLPRRPPPPPVPAPPLAFHAAQQSPVGSADASAPPPPSRLDTQIHPGKENVFRSQVTASEVSPVLPTEAALPSPEQLLRLLTEDGMPTSLNRHWDSVRLLQEQEAFSLAQVAWIFDEYRKAPFVKRMGRSREDEGELPLGNRIVQLFTNFVCARIPELTAEQTTCFVAALTSQALPMDEFWLFMMAKQIQDTADKYSPQQIATISRCYADNDLEDDEFFGALSARVTRGLDQFPLSQLANFLFACAKIRFLDEVGMCDCLCHLVGRVLSKTFHDIFEGRSPSREHVASCSQELCEKAFPLFEDCFRARRKLD